MWDYVFKKLLDLLVSHQENKSKLSESAIRSIFEALNATQGYWADVDTGVTKSSADRQKLSRLWGLAALDLRKLDGDFAQVCEQKSQYFLFPEEWSESRIKSSGIQLSAVTSRFHALAYPAKSEEVESQEITTLNRADDYSVQILVDAVYFPSLVKALERAEVPSELLGISDTGLITILAHADEKRVATLVGGWKKTITVY